jgi:ribosomal protein S10
MKITLFLYSQKLNKVLKEIHLLLEKINKYFKDDVILLGQKGRNKKIMVLRSPFVNKKSREKFNLKTG